MNEARYPKDRPAPRNARTGFDPEIAHAQIGRLAVRAQRLDERATPHDFKIALKLRRRARSLVAHTMRTA